MSLLCYPIVFYNTNQQILPWSEIFDQFSLKHNYLLEKLKLNQKIWMEKHTSANDVLSDAKNNSAKINQLEVPTKLVCNTNS